MALVSRHPSSLSLYHIYIINIKISIQIIPEFSTLSFFMYEYFQSSVTIFWRYLVSHIKYPNIYELRCIYIGRKFEFSPQACMERVYRTCITRPSFIPGRLLEFVIIFRISLSTFQIGLPCSRAFSQCMIIAKRAIARVPIIRYRRVAFAKLIAKLSQ